MDLALALRRLDGDGVTARACARAGDIARVDAYVETRNTGGGGTHKGPTHRGPPRTEGCPTQQGSDPHKGSDPHRRHTDSVAPFPIHVLDSATIPDSATHAPAHTHAHAHARAPAFNGYLGLSDINAWQIAPTTSAPQVVDSPSGTVLVGTAGAPSGIVAGAARAPSGIVVSAAGTPSGTVLVGAPAGAAQAAATSAVSSGRPDGTFLIRWRAERCGLHQLSFLLNGEHMRCSRQMIIVAGAPDPLRSKLTLPPRARLQPQQWNRMTAIVCDACGNAVGIIYIYKLTHIHTYI